MFHPACLLASLQPFPKAAEALQLDVMQAVSESRVPLSDLALCAPSPEEMEANGMVPYAP